MILLSDGRLLVGKRCVHPSIHVAHTTHWEKPVTTSLCIWQVGAISWLLLRRVGPGCGAEARVPWQGGFTAESRSGRGVCGEGVADGGVDCVGFQVFDYGCAEGDVAGGCGYGGGLTGHGVQAVDAVGEGGGVGAGADV